MGQTKEWTKKEKKKKERFRDTNESVVFKKYFVNFYLIFSTVSPRDSWTSDSWMLPDCIDEQITRMCHV